MRYALSMSYIRCWLTPLEVIHVTPWSITIGLLTIATFFLSIFAAILCAELYLLLSTGMLGKMWRMFTLSVMIFAIAEIVSFSEAVGLIRIYGLSQFLRVTFLALFCIGFWQQRQAFVKALGIKHSSMVLHILSAKLFAHRRRINVAELNGVDKPQGKQVQRASGNGSK